MSSVGQRIAELRREERLNQQEFADRIGTSRSHITNLESNRKTLSTPLLRLICLEFSVNEEWLISGDGQKYNQGIIDMMDLMESARGREPRDRKGEEKADALMIASELYSIFPNIANSCESISYFLVLFRHKEFCDLFNILVDTLTYSSKDNGALFATLRIILNGIAAELPKTMSEKDIQMRIDRFYSEPLAKYLKGLHDELESDRL